MIAIEKIFTEEEKKENLRKGVQALRENPRKAIGVMQDCEGGRCCLCVLAHVAEDVCEIPRNSLCGCSLPEFDLRAVFAFRSSGELRPKLFDIPQPDGTYKSATAYNDGNIHSSKPEDREYSHAEIADLIEQHFLS